jgi:putative PIN family toxin of toxin-antitoxin system
VIVVLDTNVILSALLSPNGAPGEIFSRWESDEFGVIISPGLLHELERALNYPKIAGRLKLAPEEASLFLSHFAAIATVVEPRVKLEAIVKDPDDNRVLECAVAGHAAYIVSGDKHLLELEEYMGIVILPPSGFLTVLDIGK